jgi:chorismate-pyruvate lyase
MQKIAALALLTVWLSAAPPAAPGGVDRLRDDLLASSSATQVLTRYCDTLHLASPPVIRALRDDLVLPAPPEVRQLLGTGPDDVIRHRRVRLACGAHVLSNADNWYLPSRLTPEMNRLLDETQTPFGTAVRELDFHRRTLEAATPGGAAILRIQAVLLTRDEKPFSVVIENYSPDLIAR